MKEMTAAQAAKFLGVTTSRIQAAAKKSQIPHRVILTNKTIGWERVYTPEDLLTWHSKTPVPVSRAQTLRPDITFDPSERDLWSLSAFAKAIRKGKRNLMELITTLEIPFKKSGKNIYLLPEHAKQLFDYLKSPQFGVIDQEEAK